MRNNLRTVDRFSGRGVFTFLWAALFALTSVTAIPAFAQDDDDDDDDLGLDDDDEDEDEDEESDDEDEDEDSEDDGEEEASSSGEGEAKKSAGDNLGAQTSYVIQGRTRLIGRSFEIAPQFLQSINDRFQSHTGFMLSGLYHIKENIALEASVGSFFWWDKPGDFFQSPSLQTAPRFGGRDTDTTTELRERERLQPELVKLYRLTWLATADVQWSPIYGKVSLHDLVLGQFSVYLSVGAGFAGLFNTEAPGIPNPLDGLTSGLGIPLGPVQLTTTIGGGLRFYFLDWLGVRLEIRDYVQPLALLANQAQNAAVSTFEVRNTLLVQLGISFIIPAPWK